TTKKKARAKPAPPKARAKPVPAKAPRDDEHRARPILRDHDDDSSPGVGKPLIGDALTAAKAGESRGKYVYCIIRAKQPLRFGRLGIGTEPAEVHTINYR